MKSKVAWLLCFAAMMSSTVFAQQTPAQIAPATKPQDGRWEEIDQRLIFLMERLASLEASLDAVESAIGKLTGKRTASVSAAKRAEAGNELMDRKGGGPMKWSEFYGRTAEKFFYHPVDSSTSYHTTTILTQQGPQADNKVGGGVPASQGVPVHQRPPQFDYIYRANESAKGRAEQEAAEMRGKIDALLERRQRLEVEQAGLWCEVAFHSVSHYDLDKKPLYRFEPLVTDATSEGRRQAETLKTAASFMRLALSIIEEAQKDQSTTFSKIKPAVSEARQQMSDAFLRLAVDVTDRKSAEGRFALLAKKLDDVASNLSDSYVVANEGDQAKDQQRKDRFRALLQESLVNYAQIILAMDEMSTMMKDEWKVKPDVDKPIQFVSLASVEAIAPSVGSISKAAPGPAVSQSSSEFISLLQRNSLDGWHLFDRPWDKSKPNQVSQNWQIRDGVLTNVADGKQLVTDDKYQDFELEFEFQIPENCNSGIYLRGRYELKLKDFDGFQTPPDQRCGAIFRQVAPSTNAFLGPNKWNKVYVKLTGKVLTVVMNNKPIISNFTLLPPGPSSFDQNENEPGPIMLHARAIGIGIKYRNIRIRQL